VPRLGRVPGSYEAVHVVGGDLAAVELAQVQGGVGRRGLAPGVRVDQDVVVVAEQAGVQRAAVEPDLAVSAAMSR
jgi:hypothetical protein